MAAKCWILDVRPLAVKSQFEKALCALAWPERREKALAYAHPSGRLLSLGAGLVCAQALRDFGAQDLRLACGAHGKPYLVSYPDIHFSIAHSGHIALCAVSDSPIGADVEKPRPYPARVAARCLQSEELAFAEQADDPARAFARLWTRKESVLKRSGEGLSRSMAEFSVWPDAPDSLFFDETEKEGHLLCVCRSGASPTEWIEWSPEFV